MKVKDFFKNNYKFILIFLLIIWCSNFCYPLNLDEVWNYGFSNNIYRGLIPYKDFNMVITPFYPFFMSIPFHIFGSNELVMIISNALLVTYFLYLIDKMIGDKFLIIFMFMLVPSCGIIPSYNVFLFGLLVILITLEEKKDINHYLIGFVLGILVLTKQTVGFCMLLPSLYYIKDIRAILKRIIGFIIPIGIFIIYLVCTGSFYNFIDLCFLGLLDFTGNNRGFNFLLVLSIIMVICTIYFIIKGDRNIRSYYVLSFYSILIPLVDLAHFLYAFWGFLILALPKINFKFISYKLFSYAVIIIFTTLVLFDNIQSGSFSYPNNFNHFNYRLINRENSKMTNLVNKYILDSENKVILFDGNGYYFRIINDEDCTYLDLLNTGNWGYGGSKKLIKEIKKHPEYLYLVNNNEFRDDAQTDKKALKYIVKNGNLIDKVGVYEVYTFANNDV